MKRLIAICTLLLVLFVPCRSIFTDVTDQVVSVFAAENDESVKVTVDRVVDGDTFVTYIDGEKTRVRMIGVDTPESVHADESRNTRWGKKISKWVKKQLTGKEVKLVFDKERLDQYGRTLAYVYLGKMMFNKTLLKKGYARAVYYAPNGAHRKEFNKLQKKAKKAKKGFWKDGYYAAFPRKSWSRYCRYIRRIRG